MNEAITKKTIKHQFSLTIETADLKRFRLHPKQTKIEGVPRLELSWVGQRQDDRLKWKMHASGVGTNFIESRQPVWIQTFVREIYEITLRVSDFRRGPLRWQWRARRWRTRAVVTLSRTTRSVLRRRSRRSSSTTSWVGRKVKRRLKTKLGCRSLL